MIVFFNTISKFQNAHHGTNWWFDQFQMFGPDWAGKLCVCTQVPRPFFHSHGHVWLEQISHGPMWSRVCSPGCVLRGAHEVIAGGPQPLGSIELFITLDFEVVLKQTKPAYWIYYRCPHLQVWLTLVMGSNPACFVLPPSCPSLRWTSLQIYLRDFISPTHVPNCFNLGCFVT